jgi:hypothetical protein
MLDISSRFAWPNRQVAFSTAAILKAYRSFAQAGEPAATSATMAGLNEMLVESKKLRSVSTVPRRSWSAGRARRGRRGYRDARWVAA